MSIHSTKCDVTYDPTPGQVQFPFDFGAMEPTDIHAYDVNSLSGTKTEIIGIIVTPANGDIRNGGTVTLPAAVAIGDQVEIRRETEQIQPNAYEMQARIPPERIEDGLDRLTMIAQELKNQTDPNAISDLKVEVGQLDAAVALLQTGKVDTTDPRLTDARTPTAHKASHAAGGTDALAPGDIGAVAANDYRLTNARTPTTHASTHGTSGSDKITPAMIGAIAEGDSRLSDARTPKAHAASHLAGGSDAIAMPIASPVQVGLAKGDELTIRTNNNGTLTALSSGGGMPLAPSTGGPYGAVGAEWFEITGGGGGTYDHNQLTSASRMLANQHPISSITDLTETLAVIDNDLTAKAPLASPSFSGAPKAPTPAAGDNSTNIATTAWVTAKNYAPSANPTFSGTIAIPSGSVLSIPGVLTVTGSANLGANATATTPGGSDSSTKVATTSFVNAFVNGKGYAPASNPTLTGIIAIPSGSTLSIAGGASLGSSAGAATQETSSNSTLVATTAFVRNAINAYAATPVDYSTAEKDTGSKWIDGKKIWRKTVNFGMMPNAAWKTMAHGVANISQFVYFEGYMYGAGQQTYAQWASIPNYTTFIGAGLTEIGVYCSNNLNAYASSYITIYYTCTDR